MLTLLACAVLAADPATAATESPAIPAEHRDRSPGVPLSRFGTFLPRGAWLVELGAEHRVNADFEYDAEEIGFPQIGPKHHGRYEADDASLLVAYGVAGVAAVQVEAHALRASLQKEANDLSLMPDTVTRSGLGEVRARVHGRWFEEKGARPELFSFAGVVFPHDEDRGILIGTPEWLFTAGTGLIKELPGGKGTVILRVAGEYDLSSGSELDWAEYGVEYLKRISPDVTIVASYVNFSGDESTIGGELQWALTPRVGARLGHRVGVVSKLLSATSNSTDSASNAALLFSF